MPSKIKNMSQSLVSNGGDKKMAESRGSLIAKSVSKHAGRAKEKFLQNLGKVDRTADEIFDEHLQNFNKQQNNATKLQKEFNNYIRCIRAAKAASKSLMDTLNEMYESGWLGHELLYTQSENVEMMWNDFSNKMADQVLIPLNTYQAQFPEMKKKIEKRGRKLTDYDNARHNAQSLMSANAGGKKKDDAKAMKIREQLEEAKQTYNILNSELHDELPALYDSRVLFLVNNLQTYFAAEQNFHFELSKVYNELEAIVDRLATDSQRMSYSVKKLHSPNNVNNYKMTSPASSSHVSVNEESPSPPSPHLEDLTLDDKPEPPLTNGKSVESGEDVKKVEQILQKLPEDGVEGSVAVAVVEGKDAGENDNEPVPNGNGNGLPMDNQSQVLYKVKATYKYKAEDEDELSFEVGEIIKVVEYDDPEEREDGWLMGIKDTSGEKGMFPANFTRPL